jgi:hypothetical protein
MRRRRRVDAEHAVALRHLPRLSIRHLGRASVPRQYLSSVSDVVVNPHYSLQSKRHLRSASPSNLRLDSLLPSALPPPTHLQHAMDITSYRCLASARWLEHSSSHCHDGGRLDRGDVGAGQIGYMVSCRVIQWPCAASGSCGRLLRCTQLLLRKSEHRSGAWCRRGRPSC